MKALFFVALASITTLSFAQGRSKNIDCSRAAEGIVTLNYKTVTKSMDEAIASAYRCLSSENSSLKSVNSQLLKAAKKEEPMGNCKLDKINTLILKSWEGSRVSVHGEKGGEAVYLVQQPVTCADVGTGLFYGTVSNNLMVIEVIDNAHFTRNLNSKSQTITVTLRKMVDAAALESSL